MTIWVGTDWHLVNYNQRMNIDMESPKAYEILMSYRETVSPDDLFIYLGDLCHKYFTNEDRLKKMILPLPGYKVLVKGNHDTMPNSAYYAAGFNIVTDAAKLDRFLFTHKPYVIPKNSQIINIHGHLHSEKMVRIDKKHVNPYGYCGGKFTELRRLLTVLHSTVESLDDSPVVEHNGERLPLLSELRPEEIFDLSELVINGPDGHPMDETASKRVLSQEEEILNDLVFGFDDVYLSGLLGRPDGKSEEDAVLEK